MKRMLLGFFMLQAGAGGLLAQSATSDAELPLLTCVFVPSGALRHTVRGPFGVVAER